MVGVTERERGMTNNDILFLVFFDFLVFVFLSSVKKKVVEHHPSQN